MTVQSSPTRSPNPTDAPTRRTEWQGRRRRWLWIGLAAGIWFVGLVVVYVWLARSASSSLEAARVELQATISQLPKPDGFAAKARERQSSSRHLSAMGWVASMSGAFTEALGHQTLPPRLPGGVARALTVPVEVFSPQPHYGISSQRSDGPQKTAPECAQVDPEVLADEMRLANWRTELEDRPRELLANRDCFALVMDWLESIDQLPGAAFDVTQVFPTPTERWFEQLESEQLEAFGPALAGAVCAARGLADAAVADAARGDAASASEHLSQALAACDALAGIGWVTGYVAWSEAEVQVLERVALCMVLLDPTELPTELDAHLEGLHARERYLAALPGELRLIERDFARAKAGLSTRAQPSGDDEFGVGPIASVQMEQELADNFRAWVAHAKWAEAAPYSAGAPPHHIRNVLASNVFDFRLMPPTVGSRHPWGELAALGELVQLARIATRDGVAAAQAAASARIDPFSGLPYPTRLEPDGTLVLWSVGEDRKDDNAQPRLTCDPALDLVVRVLTR